MSEEMSKEENLKYQLMEFSNSDPRDLDTEFEVCYENAQGMECWVDVCAIELAERAFKRIEELEAKLASAAGAMKVQSDGYMRLKKELEKCVPISKLEEFTNRYHTISGRIIPLQVREHTLLCTIDFLEGRNYKILPY